MGNPQETVSEAELGWLAGIIDGEGSIVMFYQTKKGRLQGAHPQIWIGNTEKVMIEKVADILGRLGVGVHIEQREPKGPNGVSGKQKAKYKTMHFASVVGFKRARKFLEIITPYLVTSKREKAELTLRYVRQRCAKIYPNGDRVWAGRAPLDVSDLTLMKQIAMLGHTKHMPLIDGFLRDLTQNAAKKQR